MSSVHDENIGEFLRRAISSEPTPGGASSAALAAALGAAMVGMVASLTLGKKAYALYQEAAGKVLGRCQELMDELQDLTGRDMKAYNAYMEAVRLPQNSEAEARIREQALEEAGQQATEIPLTICQTCLAVIEQASTVADFGNRTAVSDAGAGVYLAWGALQASMLNVDINLLSLKDKSFAAIAQARRRDILEEGEGRSQAALAKIQRRIHD
ncbi:MAG: cyclodeaminase/cyclohydrolase family protein [Desulfarculales bacterium]|jgi:formiminotetrahydrofolate cyclodeaminase|nr:cyclodeaminase/cyclohydrolase family protein [Desulfarculales bacterium]